VSSVTYDHPSGQPVATVAVTMVNQSDAVMATGDAELLLPTETQPAA